MYMNEHNQPVPCVYVAGPLNADDAAKYLRHTARMCRATLDLLHRGFSPYCPALDLTLGLIDGHFQYQDYFNLNQPWLAKADAVYVLDHSPGTDREIATAQSLGIPIFYEKEHGLDTLTAWKDARSYSDACISAAGARRGGLSPVQSPTAGGGTSLPPTVPEVREDRMPGLPPPLSPRSPLPDVPPVRMVSLRVGDHVCTSPTSFLMPASCSGYIQRTDETGNYPIRVRWDDGDTGLYKPDELQLLPSTEVPPPGSSPAEPMPGGSPSPEPGAVSASLPLSGATFYGHPRFYELLNLMASIHSAKNHDYAGTADPLANLRLCSAAGIPPWKGVVVRLSDKFSRLQTFAKQGNLKVSAESIQDTLIDMAIYALLCAVLIEEENTHA